MAENVYECLLIFESSHYARDQAGVPKILHELVEQAGGEILASRLWEERRLAYPIKGQRKGTYWLTYFRLESLELTGIHRQLEINDAILRYLTIKLDPRLVEPMVSHASNQPVAVGAAADSVATTEASGEAEEDDE